MKAEYKAPEQLIREINLNRARNRRAAANERAAKFLEVRNEQT
jgi:hypothetical protein